jgi:hypothetical protein
LATVVEEGFAIAIENRLAMVIERGRNGPLFAKYPEEPAL